MKKEQESRAGQAGFSLVELIVVVGISTIVLAGVAGLFMTTNEVYTVQDQMVRIQQDLRNDLTRLTNDIRMAGLNPTGDADCAGINTANETGIRLRYDYDEDGTCNVDRDYQYDNSTKELEVQRGGGGGYQTISEDIDTVAFSYVMGNGTTLSSTTDFQDIDEVQIQICGKISGGYSEDYNGTTCFSTGVKPRNIGLDT